MPLQPEATRSLRGSARDRMPPRASKKCNTCGHLIDWQSAQSTRASIRASPWAKCTHRILGIRQNQRQPPRLRPNALISVTTVSDTCRWGASKRDIHETWPADPSCPSPLPLSLCRPSPSHFSGSAFGATTRGGGASAPPQIVKICRGCSFEASSPPSSSALSEVMPLCGEPLGERG